MINNVKKTVSAFKKKYRLNEITEETICSTLEKQGYTTIYFNAILNDGNVEQIISNLNLEDTITRHKGFTYSNDKYRLVFINEDLSSEERLMILAHEEGHIFCEHMNCSPIIGQDVRQEHEANEFAHYLLYPDNAERIKSALRNRKKTLISICACLLFIAIGVAIFSFVKSEPSYYGSYYVTTSGNKYHEKGCIFVKNKDNIRILTKEELESGEYEPCQICLPNH